MFAESAFMCSVLWKRENSKKQGRVVSEYKLKVCCLDRFAAPAFIIQYYGKRRFKKKQGSFVAFQSYSLMPTKFAEPPFMCKVIFCLVEFGFHFAMRLQYSPFLFFHNASFKRITAVKWIRMWVHVVNILQEECNNNLFLVGRGGVEPPSSDFQSAA